MKSDSTNLLAVSLAVTIRLAACWIGCYWRRKNDIITDNFA